MAQVDASIPLQTKRPEFMNPAQMLSLQSMAQQMQQQKQEAPFRLSHLQNEQAIGNLTLQDMANKVETHNKMRALTSQQGTYEEDGTPSADGVRAAMSIDPATFGKEFSTLRREGIKARTEETYKKLQIQEAQGKVAKDFADVVKENQTSLAKLYDATLSKSIQMKSLSPDEDALNAVHNEAERRLKASLINKAQYENIMGTKWDADFAKGIIAAATPIRTPGEYEDMLKSMGYVPGTKEWKQKMEERRVFLTEHPSPVAIMQTTGGQNVTVEPRRAGKPPIVTKIDIPGEPDGGLQKPGAQEGKPLPASAAQKILENQQNVRKAEVALQMIEGGVGPSGKAGDPNATGIKGYVPDAILQRKDPGGVETRAAIADLGSMIIHDRSGAAVTAAEYPRLKPFIPTVTDDPATVKTKLRRFVTVYKEIVDDASEFYRESGYKVPEIKSSLKGAPDTTRPTKDMKGPQSKGKTIVDKTSGAEVKPYSGNSGKTPGDIQEILDKYK